MKSGDTVTVEFRVKEVKGDRVECEVAGESFDLPKSAVTEYVMPTDSQFPRGQGKSNLGECNRLFSQE